MRFHAQGQEAEPGKKAPGGCRSSRARFLETPSMPRALVSEERTDSFVLFSCGRPPARSPKVTHVPRQPFPGATSWSRRRRHHVFPAEQARAAAWWPFHPRTRGLGPAYGADPEGARGQRLPGHPATPLHLPLGLRRSAQPPRPPALTSRSRPLARPPAASTRVRATLPGAPPPSLTRRRLCSPRWCHPHSARLLQGPQPPDPGL